MVKLWHALVLATLIALAICASGAIAATGAITCTTGSATTLGGNVFVNGNCTFTGDSLTITGNLIVADNAVLNAHAASRTTVHINGNAIVGNNAVLGLGAYGPPGIRTETTVDGNIIGNQPRDLYLSGITVRGNVISNGGGPGTSEFLNFPTKDNTIGGNLIMQGWQGGWLGALRNTVGGNLIVSRNASVIHCTQEGPFGSCLASAPGPDVDSTEVTDNVVSGNLICQNNTPAAQVGDSEGGPNLVSGRKIGECAGL
jgi:hypothetical protein